MDENTILDSDEVKPDPIVGTTGGGPITKHKATASIWSRFFIWFSILVGVGIIAMVVFGLIAYYLA